MVEKVQFMVLGFVGVGGGIRHVFLKERVCGYAKPTLESKGVIRQA